MGGPSGGLAVCGEERLPMGQLNMQMGCPIRISRDAAMCTGE